MSKFGVSCWKWFFIMAIILVMSGVVINNSDNQKTQDSKIMGKAFIEDLNSLGTKGDSNKLEVESNQQIIETGQEPLEEETLDEIEDFQTEFQEIEMKQEPLEEETLDEIEDFQTELQERQCVPQFLSKTKCQGNAVMKEYQESNCNIIWALWGECDSLCKEGKCVETICIPGNMECNGKYVQKCIKVGSDWEINYEYCSTGCEDGKCKPTCTSGYLGEKRCSGNSIEVKYQSPDCSYKWIYQYDCSEKCVEGMCVYKSQTRDDSEPTCEQKYFDEYQCSGDRYERGLQDSNCSIVWVLWESCKYGCGTDGKCNPQPMETSDVRVSSVIAGDTIKLDNGEIVRLIGINAPEKGEKCYEESIGHFTSLVEGKEVTLERDVENRGQYGRLLRYVFVRGIHVNVNMVEQGKL